MLVQKCVGMFMWEEGNTSNKASERDGKQEVGGNKTCWSAWGGGGGGGGGEGGGGDTLRAATTTSDTSTETSSWASAVEAPRWGVQITSCRPTSGWSAGGGSTANTSSAACGRAAPLSWPHTPDERQRPAVWMPGMSSEPATCHHAAEEMPLEPFLTFS